MHFLDRLLSCPFGAGQEYGPDSADYRGDSPRAVLGHG